MAIVCIENGGIRHGYWQPPLQYGLQNFKVLGSSRLAAEKRQLVS
jgi:hypothetical protein